MDISEQIIKTGKARVRGLGSFQVLEVKGRKTYSFVTGKIEQRKPYKIVSFRPSRRLKDIINKKRKP